MTESELERIKSAYNSGLKVQIWFNGYWKDFDAGEYPNGGFSTVRMYRIAGSEYAEKAEAKITEAKKLLKSWLKEFNCKLSFNERAELVESTEAFLKE